MASIREFLQVTKESAFRTPKASPVRGTDQIPVRLSGANFFTMRGTPIVEDVPGGGGRNVVAASVNDKHELKGRLQTELGWSNAELLLGWALSPINSGQTAPWTTTEPAGQYASCALDHAYFQDDAGTMKRKRNRGCKVDSGSLSFSDAQRRLMISLDIIGSVYDGNIFDASADPNATVFPVPTPDEFVGDGDFVTFNQSNGGLLIGGTPFTFYHDLTINWQYGTVVDFYANRFAQRLRSWSRTVVYP